ncbi:MAG: hypothetical protein ABSH16_10245 [Sedimentisphaerales bacterium]
MKTNRTRTSCIVAFTMLVAFATAVAEESRWWPVQAMPKAIIRLEDVNTSPDIKLSYDMTAQSVAGLAAKAVNEGRGDEMVWVRTGNVDMEDWLARLMKREPQLETRGVFGLWDLVDRYTKNGLIKGYILYRPDHSKGEINQHRQGMDCSVNVATSMAGLLDGIIVDEKLEGEVKSHGLRMLMDARDRSQKWCFKTYKDKFNRRMVCVQDPRKPNVRDFAISQKAFTMYGYDEPIQTVVKWLEPLSPILGWGGDDEFQMTELFTLWGHFQTGTDWCINLPVLMAGTEKYEQARVRSFDPRTIDFNDTRSTISFIDTDGDNTEWFEGNFFRSVEGKDYWSSPQRGTIPFGWSCCFAHLSQLCPEAIDYAAATQSPNDWFVEFGGGYYYPDLFGLKRPNRWELLGRHARRTWELMKKNNTRIIGFNVSKLDSSDALKSYEIFASQTDGLLAILIFQYDGYEAGAGKVFWVKDRNGIEIPVITARYSIWNRHNQRKRSGTPAKVAREIRQTVENSPPAELPRYDWVIAHAWSWFRQSPGDDENAENMPQENASKQGGTRVYAPVMWCAERLSPNIRIISPEEMAWRIRMKHNPEQTRKLIQDWQQ